MRAVLGEHAIGFLQAGAQKAEVVVEHIRIGQGTNRDGLVSPSLKPGAIAIDRGHGLFLRQRLLLSRVEGRVDIDEIDARRRQRLEYRQALTEVDTMLH